PGRSPRFLSVVLGASLIQASHAVMYGFATLQWNARGISGPAIGALWAIGVIAEVALFALSGRLVGWFGAIGMIMLGGIGGAVRWTAMAFDPPTAPPPPALCRPGWRAGSRWRDRVGAGAGANVWCPREPRYILAPPAREGGDDFNTTVASGRPVWAAALVMFAGSASAQQSQDWTWC